MTCCEWVSALVALEEFSKHCPHRQTDTTVALIYKMDLYHIVGFENSWLVINIVDYSHNGLVAPHDSMLGISPSC